MNRKFIAFLLTIALVIGCMPLCAYADGQEVRATVTIGEYTLDANNTSNAALSGVSYDAAAHSLTINGDELTGALPNITYEVLGENRPLTLIVSGVCTVGAIESDGSLTVSGAAASSVLNIKSNADGINFLNGGSFNVVGNVDVKISARSNGILAENGLDINITNAAVNIASSNGDSIHLGLESTINLSENATLHLESNDDAIEIWDDDLSINVLDSAELTMDTNYGIYQPADYQSVCINVSGPAAKLDINADGTGIYSYGQVDFNAGGAASVTIDAIISGISTVENVGLKTSGTAKVSISSQDSSALSVWGHLELTAEDSSNVTLSSIEEYGAYVTYNPTITVSDSAVVNFTAVNDVALFSWGELNARLLGNAKLNVSSELSGGFKIENIQEFSLNNNAEASFSGREDALTVFDHGKINLQDSAKLSFVSLEGNGLNVEGNLTLAITGSAVLNAQARGSALRFADHSEVTIGGSSTLSAVGFTGLDSVDLDSVVIVSGGALDVLADDSAMYQGNLKVSGGSVKMIGYSKALNNLLSLEVDGVETTCAGVYDVLGVPFLYPSTSAINIAQVGSTQFADLNAAYAAAVASGYEIKLINNIDLPVVLTLTSPGSVTIDAANRSAANLVLVYKTSEASVSFVSAEAVNCAVRIEPDYIDGYYNNEKILVSGLSAEKCALELAGYTFYAADSGLAIIKTVDAPFAVAETTSEGIVTKFRFFKALKEAVEASSGSAVSNTVYVLNYYNTSTLERLSYIDVSEQTTPQALSIGGITFKSVLRMTNGVYSSFYVWSDEKWQEQYSNGPMRIAAQDDVSAALTGYFTGESYYCEHITVLPNNDFCGIVLQSGYEPNAIMLNLTNGAILPQFAPLQKTEYELIGYFTDLNSGQKIINPDGTLVSLPVLYNGAELFNAEGKFVYNGIAILYAHWKQIGRDEVDENANVKIGEITLDKDHKTDGQLPGIEYIPDTNTLKIDNYSKADVFDNPLKLTYNTVNPGYALNILVNKNASFGGIESNGSLNIKGHGTLYVVNTEDSISMLGSANKLYVEEGATLIIESGSDGLEADSDLELVVKGKLYIESENDAFDANENFYAEISGNGFVDIVAHDDGFTVSKVCNISIKDNARVIINSDSDAITQNDTDYSLTINLSERAELIANGYCGINAAGSSSISIEDNAKVNTDSNESCFAFEGPSDFSVKDNAMLSIGSRYGFGMAVDDSLQFTASGHAGVNISAGKVGILAVSAHQSIIQIKDNANVNIEAYYGMALSPVDAAVYVSGGATTIKASYGIINGNLNANAGKISIAGYNSALNGLEGLYEDGINKDWTDYSLAGSIYNYPHTSQGNIASVGGTTYTDLDKAYAAAIESNLPIVILKDLTDSVSLALTSSAAVTINANDKNVSNLLLAYCCTDTKVTFTSADAVKCTVCMPEECQSYYLNESQPVLITGLNAAQTSINLPGISMYQEEHGSGLIAIETLSAPFAVAETVSGSAVTSFRFFRDIEDAKTAASAAAVPNTIYVLNYENPVEGIYVAQVDLSEQTTPDAVTLSGLTMTTVTRYTNGISSAFYTGKAGESNLQYTNGNSFTPGEHGNMTATLIGNFDITNCTQANIVIAPKGDFRSLTIKDPRHTVEDVKVYMRQNSMIPNFALAHMDGYELKGYYINSWEGGRIFVLDANGQPITAAAIHVVYGQDPVRFFDDNGGWSGEFPTYWDMTFYAQLDKLPEKDNGGGSGGFGGGGGNTPAKNMIAEEYAAIAAEKFEDVNIDDYYAAAVGWALENNVTAGISETMFGPKSSCNRGQVVTFLYRIAGEPDVAVSDVFSDVNADAYYAKAVSWALANGITSGYAPGKFNPSGIITRAQFVTFLYRTAKTLGLDVSLGSEANIDQFTDKDEVSDFAKEAFEWAVSNGIVKGTTETTLGSKGNCLRGQVVTFLYRFFGAE